MLSPVRRFTFVALATTVVCAVALAAPAAPVANAGNVANAARVPTILSPAEGSRHTLAFDVAVAASSPRVQIELEGWPVERRAVVDGHAHTTFDPSGLAAGSHYLRVHACNASDVCDAAYSELHLTIDHAGIAPKLVTPVEGQVVGRYLEVQAAAFNTDDLLVLLDGDYLGRIFDPHEPATFGLTGVDAGWHEVTLRQCSGLNANACSGPISSVVRVRVAEQLNPRVTTTTSAFSPNGDGRSDTLAVDYSLNVDQAVSWRVVERVSAAGEQRVLKGPFDLGMQAAGAHQLVWDGRDNDGTLLPEGAEYRLVLDTTKESYGITVAGRAEQALTIDTTAAAWSNKSTSNPVVFPHRDGFNDRVALSVTPSEPISLRRLEIADAQTEIVSRHTSIGVRTGTISMGWSGRASSGRELPSGEYTYRFVLEDAAGNSTTTTWLPVSVDARRLVKHTGTTTVSAGRSRTGVRVGSCSSITTPARPTWKGSIAYLSNSDLCHKPTPTHTRASTTHSVRLPSAQRYGLVRVDAYGAPRDLSGTGTGWLRYATDSGATSSPDVLTTTQGWHNGTARPGSTWVEKGDLHWVVGAAQGKSYDVKGFRITFTYFRLE